MVSYTKDMSAFKKWLPVKAWLDKKKIPAVTVSSVPVVCDQVHRTVNTQFVYMRDGLNDVWYTPEQFEKAQGGDCEDFSIYKMYRLSQSGVSLSKMELVICTDRLSREHHAVLRVFSGNYQYILDNQSLQLLNKDSFLARYEPIYAINTTGWRICSV